MPASWYRQPVPSPRAPAVLSTFRPPLSETLALRSGGGAVTGPGISLPPDCGGSARVDPRRPAGPGHPAQLGVAPRRDVPDSRPTVRRAMAVLKAEGLVVTNRAERVRACCQLHWNDGLRPLPVRPRSASLRERAPCTKWLGTRTGCRCPTDPTANQPSPSRCDEEQWAPNPAVHTGRCGVEFLPW